MRCAGRYPTSSPASASTSASSPPTPLLPPAPKFLPLPSVGSPFPPVRVVAGGRLGHLGPASSVAHVLLLLLSSSVLLCRRRLPVVMVRLKMSENLKEAVTFIEQVTPATYPSRLDTCTASTNSFDAVDVTHTHHTTCTHTHTHNTPGARSRRTRRRDRSCVSCQPVRCFLRVKLLKCVLPPSCRRAAHLSQPQGIRGLRDMGRQLQDQGEGHEVQRRARRL